MSPLVAVTETAGFAGASHAAGVSQPEAVAELILEAARLPAAA
jgi:hypothetical protein